MTTPTDMEAFEAWMRTLLHYPYDDGWFWHQYKAVHGHWPTPKMKARGREMRAEYLERKR